MQHFNRRGNVTKFQTGMSKQASCVNDKFFKFSFNKLLKFRHISKTNTWYCVAYVAIITLFWFITFIHAHTHTHTYTHTHTHAHTHTHTDLNFAIFWKDHEIKYTSNWDNTGSQNLIHKKFKFLNENFRSNKDSIQIERNKLK